MLYGGGEESLYSLVESSFYYREEMRSALSRSPSLCLTRTESYTRTARCVFGREVAGGDHHERERGPIPENYPLERVEMTAPSYRKGGKGNRARLPQGRRKTKAGGAEKTEGDSAFASHDYRSASQDGRSKKKGPGLGRKSRPYSSSSQQELRFCRREKTRAAGRISKKNGIVK